MKGLMEENRALNDKVKYLRGKAEGKYENNSLQSELKELQMKNRMLELENKRAHEVLIQKMRELEMRKN